MSTSGDSGADGLLEWLLHEWENETVEFKTAATTYDRGKLGTYVSALSNEARLRSLPAAWFILGVDNTRTIVGTEAFSKDGQLTELAHHISEGIDQSLTVRRVHEVCRAGKRVLILELSLIHI